MTSPSLVSSTVTSITSSTTAHVYDLPGTVAAGDLLVAWLVAGSSTLTAGSTLTSDWVNLFDEYVIAYHRWQCWVRRADGTEGGTTISATAGSAVKGGGVIQRVSGAWGSGGEGTAYEVCSVTATGYGTGPNPNLVSAPWGSADQLYLAAATSGSTGATYTAPSGYSNLAQVSTSAGHCVGVAALAETSSSDDPAAFTLSTNENHQAVTLVIRPQVVSGGSEITASSSGMVTTDVTESGGSEITASSSGAMVVGSIGTGGSEITASSSGDLVLTMTGSSEITASSSGTVFARTRGCVVVTQGEQAILGGTWGAATASSCRLFVDDPSAAMTDAGRNALTEDDFTEPSFTGYAAQVLTSGNWTVTTGEPSDMTHTEVTFTKSADELPDDTNLVRWWDAADAANEADQLLPDRAGIGSDAQLGATTGPDAADPTIVMGDATTRTKLVPNGTDDYVVLDYTPSFTATTGELTVVYVGYWDDNDTTDGFNRLFSSETANNDGFHLNTSAAGVASPRLIVGGATSSKGVYPADTAMSLSDGELFAVAGVVDDGDIYCYALNHGLSSSKDITGSGTITHGATHLFARAYNQTAKSSSEWLAVVIIERALTQSQLSELCEYLMGDYPLPASIPGYYVTRDSDGALIYFDVWDDGPATISETGDSIVFQPKMEIPV